MSNSLIWSRRSFNDADNVELLSWTTLESHYLGADSLMNLVIIEKLFKQLSGTLFLEYPTVGNLRV